MTTTLERIATPADDARTATERVAQLVGELIRLEPYMTPRTRMLLGAVAQWASVPTLSDQPLAVQPTRKRSPAPNQQTLNGAT